MFPKIICRYGKKSYLCIRNSKTRNKHPCPDGGIGRRVGLKHQYLTMCRFEPGSGYKAKEWYSKAAPLFLFN